MPSIQALSQPKLRVAVQGTGNWGRNLVRALCRVQGISLDWIVDTDPIALAAAAEIAPRAKPTAHLDETAGAFDAAVVATPAAKHVAHAAALLQWGKHVLVEKPAAMRAEDAADLCRAAAAHRVTLMVGHQLCFHPAFQQLKRCVDAGMIGSPTRIHSMRTGPLDLTKEPGVIWSYGPHDISMMLTLCDIRPDRIQADVQRNEGGLALEAEIRLSFKNGVQGDIQLARRSAEKNRRFTVHGEKGSLVFEDEPGGARLRFCPADGEIQEIPFAAAPDALQSALAHFAACIQANRSPRTGPAHLTEVTKILLECERRAFVSKG